MDRRLLDILCCPATRQPLKALSAAQLDAINQRIATPGLARADGEPEPQAWREGLLTQDGRLAYRIEDGIPVLLADESVSTAQITDFPS